MRLNLWLAILSFLAAAGVIGQQVFKSTDQQGNVTYSDEPPSGASKVESVAIEAGPTEEQVKEAQARKRALEHASQSVGKERAKQREIQAKSKANARADVEQAKKQLEAAKEVGPGDRKGTAGGGSRLTESYRERVRKAEQDLEDARKRAK